MTSKNTPDDFHDLLTSSLEYLDPELDLLIRTEEERQDDKIIMIASESFAPICVRETMASAFTNLYAEGYPPQRMVDAREPHREHLWYQQAYQQRYGDRRYYKGVDVANFVESLAIWRAREAFATKNVSADQIFANVQPLSGAAANNAAYQVCVRPGDTVMGLDLTHGGHLTHGHPMNRSGIFHNVVHYQVDPKTGHLDYEKIIEQARQHKPRLIIAGFSAYPWAVNWEKFREAADAAGGYLMADIAHVAGLVAGGVYPSPVGYADIITFTTHKTLMGPRGAIILTTDRDLASKVDAAVFPGEQGGPHVNQIAAKAAILGMAQTKEYKKLQKKILDNTQALAKALVKEGMKLAYGGTDTHLLLVDLRPHKGVDACSLTGEIFSRVLDLVGLSCNKNTIAGDENAAHPSAIRLGTPWATQRGMGKKEMQKIAHIVARVGKAIRPFCYSDTGGEIGRGKLDWETQEWARTQIRELLCEFTDQTPGEVAVHPLSGEYKKRKVTLKKNGGWPLPESFKGEDKTKGAAILDRTGGEAFIVSGDPHRVLAFLSEITTCDALCLTPGKAQRGFVLGINGTVLTDITLARHDNDGAGLAHVKVIAGPCKKPSVQQWFQAISDGYTLFDEADLISKVEGPVILYSFIGEYPLTLAGDDVQTKLAKALPALKDLKAGANVLFNFENEEALAARFDFADGAQFVQITICEELFANLWSLLVKAGCTPVGMKKCTEILDGSCITAKKKTVADLAGKVDPGMLQLDKPYFVGMSSIADEHRQGGKKEAFVWNEPDEQLKQTCLFEKHLEIARKNYIVPFGGWQMPVRYGNMLEEHMAVREAAGLFDVAHMGVLEFSGHGATQFLDLITSNYVPWLLPGQSHYSYLMDEGGNVLDDIMVYKRGADLYMVVVNAGNFDKVYDYLKKVNAGKVLLDRDFPLKSAPVKIRIRDLKDKKADKQMRVDMALQGPASRAILTSMIDDPKDARRFSQMHRNEFLETRIDDKSAILSGTGYTGEPVAYELYVHPNDAPYFWDTILEKGEALGVKPCGLGARDSLRTEAGLPLYGHELAGPYDIGPGGAGYQAFVKLHKPFFVGKAAYLKAECARKQQVVRFEICGKGLRPAKQGDLVLDRNGKIIGNVTSNAALDDRQVGQAFVVANYTKPGLPVSVVSAPRDNSLNLNLGARMPVPVPGVIVDRFFRKEEDASPKPKENDLSKKPICETC